MSSDSHGGGEFVSETECADWRSRHRANEDRSIADVAAAVGRPRSTVTDHVSGRCSHASHPRGVHDVDVGEGDLHAAILDSIEAMLDVNYGDTIHTSVRRVRSSPEFEAPNGRAGIPGQKVGAVIGGLSGGEDDRGLVAERHNPDAGVARYAITRADGAERGGESA